MRRSVTQRHLYGCAVAYLAFVLQISYTRSLKLLKKRQRIYKGSYCRELLSVLQENKQEYVYNYLSKKRLWNLSKDLTIVYTKKSQEYPGGHFLVRFNSRWMDPWVNFQVTAKVSEAKSSFRNNLPGEPIYALFPTCKAKPPPGEIALHVGMLLKYAKLGK